MYKKLTHISRKISMDIKKDIKRESFNFPKGRCLNFRNISLVLKCFFLLVLLNVVLVKVENALKITKTAE